MGERTATTAATIGLGLVVQESMPGFATEQTVSPERLAFLTKLPEIDLQSRILVAMTLNVDDVTVKTGELIINTNFRNLTVYPGLIDLYTAINPRSLPDTIVVKTDIFVLREMLAGKREREEEYLRFLAKKLGNKKDSHEIKLYLMADDCQIAFDGRPQGRKMVLLMQEAEWKYIRTGFNKDADLIWISGRPAKKPQRPRRDYTKRPYVEPIKERTREELEERGWVVVSWEEALGKLRASNFLKEDLARLRHGYGIIVRPSGCECLYKIDARGEVSHVYQCPLDSHEAISIEHKQPPVLIGEKLPVNDICFECGYPLFMKTRVIETSGQRSKVYFEVYCEHHGRIESHNRWTERKIQRIGEKK